MRTDHRTSRIPLFGQITVTLSAFGLLAFWPSQSGKVLIVPLPGANDTELLTAMAQDGIRLIGFGPFDGSFVVEGDRSVVSRRLQGIPSFLVAAPSAGCSGFGDLT